MSYSTVPQYRRGRSYSTGDRSPGRGRSNIQCICGCFLLAFFFVAIPVVVYLAETDYHAATLAYSEIETGILSTHDCNPKSTLSDCIAKRISVANEHHSYLPVHIISSEKYPLSGDSSDDAFSLRIQNALTLERKTEYCQWQQYSTEVCETCKRVTNATSGQGESYPCNCKITYHYLKTWRPNLVLSLFFDQPAAHHNPQRDPYPTKKFVSENAQIGDLRIEPSVIENPNSAVRVSDGYHKLDWTRGAVKAETMFDSFSRFSERVFGFGFSGSDSRVRYEEVNNLQSLPHSEAFRRERFTYVGHGGYFFSPYLQSDFERYMKYFGEFLEGSLLDFQFGDIMASLAGSCTPGDIRVSYHVKDPKRISVIGGVTGDAEKLRNGRKTSSPAPSIHVSIGLYETSNGYKVGLVYEGSKSPRAMFDAELWLKQMYRFFAALALVFLSYITTSLYVYVFHSSGPSFTVRALGSVGAAGVALTVSRGMIWGAELAQDRTHFALHTTLFLASCALLYNLVRVVKPYRGSATLLDRLLWWFEGMSSENNPAPHVFTDATGSAARPKNKND